MYVCVLGLGGGVRAFSLSLATRLWFVHSSGLSCRGFNSPLAFAFGPDFTSNLRFSSPAVLQVCGTRQETNVTRLLYSVCVYVCVCVCGVEKLDNYGKHLGRELADTHHQHHYHLCHSYWCKGCLGLVFVFGSFLNGRSGGGGGGSVWGLSSCLGSISRDGGGWGGGIWHVQRLDTDSTTLRLKRDCPNREWNPTRPLHPKSSVVKRSATPLWWRCFQGSQTLFRTCLQRTRGLGKMCTAKHDANHTDNGFCFTNPAPI